MLYVLAGDKRSPAIIHVCKDKKQQKHLYHKRCESNTWSRVEMVSGDYNMVDVTRWEWIKEEDFIKP